MIERDDLIDVNDVCSIQASQPGKDQQKANGHDKAKALLFTLFDQIKAAPKEWLAQDFLGAGETSCWYGNPGDGKSVLIEDFGLHVAAGMEWQGRKVKQGAVLYLSLERSQLVKRRAIAFKIKHKVNGLPFAVVGSVVDFRDKNTATTILRTVAEIEKTTGQKVALIIVDTISRALCGGDENSPKDMGALIGTLGRIQEGTGAHIALVHHVPHDGDRMRGHGSLLGAVDTTVHVVRATGGRSATVIKDNDGADGQQVSFTLESVEVCADGEDITTAPVVVRLEIGEAITADVMGKAKLTDSQSRFLDILKQAINDKPADPTKVPKAAGGNPAVTRGVLKTYLLQRGWLDEDGNKARAKMSNTLNALAGKKVINLGDDCVWTV